MRRPSLALVSLGLSFALAQQVQAQEPVPTDEFSVSRFSPAPGRGNFLQVDGASVDGNLVPWAGVMLDYAHRPFVLYNAVCDPGTETNCEVTDSEAALVEYYATAHLMGAITLARRVQIGLVIPLTMASGEPFGATVDGMDIALEGGSGVGLGDPRLSGKIRLYGDEDGVAFGAVAYVTAPLGQLTAEHRYIGERLPNIGGHFVGQFSQRGFHLAANIGGVWRESAQLFSTRVTPQITYGVAFGYDVAPIASIIGELVGASTFSSDVDEHPLEGRLGARLTQGDFAFTLAGGVGLISGVGIPVFRVLAGASWGPDTADRDSDGVGDSADECADRPEDDDGFDDDDGCPELDNDSDGIPDARDRCASQAEDRDRFEDEDGCPERDNDRDGVNDDYDTCPTQAEDRDGTRDDDGCPDEGDSDHDNISDSNDRCPDQAEDTDGFGDDDGCPETDFDHDSVPDDTDECPDRAENINGVRDTDGCPDETPAAPTTGGRRRGR